MKPLERKMTVLTKLHKALTCDGALVAVGTQEELDSHVLSLVGASPEENAEAVFVASGFALWNITDYLNAVADGSVPAETA